MDLVAMVGMAVLLYIIQGIVYEKIWKKGLDAQITFQEEAAVEGDTAYLRETLCNQKALPLPMMHVKFQIDRRLKFITGENTAVTDQTYRNDVFSILPWQKITRTLQFVCQKRGYYTCSQIDLVAHDLFITKSMAEAVPVSSKLYVYPKEADREQLEIPFRQILGSVLAQKCLNEDPFEFAGIREYQSYDSMHMVNWKATARTGELKVNLHESTSSQSVMLIINMESDHIWADDDLREESIRIAASIMLKLTEEGIMVSLYSNGIDCLTEKEIFLKAGAGREHQKMVLETLSRLQYKGDIPSCIPFLKSRRKEAEYGETLYILISSSQDQQTLLEYEELCVRSVGSLWIAPLKEKTKFQEERCRRAVSMKWIVEDTKG